MQKGWIKLHRKLLDNALMNRPAYRAVWIEILLRATHDGVEVVFNGERLRLKPGQLTTGAYQLSKTTGVPRGTVERILKAFKSEEQIEVQSDRQCSLISVKNWDIYQNSEERNEERVRNDRGTSEERMRTNQEGETVETVKNEKKPLTATSVAEGKKKSNDDEAPMSLPEFYEWTKKSPQRAVHVIGEWADTIEPQIVTKGQWKVFMSRHLRAAQDVAKFTDKQIEEAYNKITELQKKSNFTPTLETLKKYLTN